MNVNTRTPSKLSRERLAELEKIIERNIKSFIEAGNALWKIRDSGYYRITHKSFESYWTTATPTAKAIKAVVEKQKAAMA